MPDLSLTIAPSGGAPPPPGPRLTGVGGFAERLARAEASPGTPDGLSGDGEANGAMALDGAAAAPPGMPQPGMTPPGMIPPGLGPLRIGATGIAGAEMIALPPAAEPSTMIPAEATGAPAKPPMTLWPPGSVPGEGALADASDAGDEAPPPDQVAEPGAADAVVGDGASILAHPPFSPSVASFPKGPFGGPIEASTQGATDGAAIGATGRPGMGAAGSTELSSASGTGPFPGAPGAPASLTTGAASDAGGGLAGDAGSTTRSDTGPWPLEARGAGSPVPETDRKLAWPAPSEGSAPVSPRAAGSAQPEPAMIRPEMAGASGSGMADGVTLGTAPMDAQGPATTAANANRQATLDDRRAGPGSATGDPPGPSAAEPSDGQFRVQSQGRSQEHSPGHSLGQSLGQSGMQFGGQGIGEHEAAPDAPPLAEAPSTGEALPFPQSPATTATSAPASPAPSTAPHAPPPVAEQLTPAIARMETGPDGVRRLTIRLEPVELGQLEIRIERTGDQAARVHLMVERPETLALLRRDQPALERALDQAGLAAEGREIILQLAPPEVRPVNAAATADPRTANGDPNGNPTGTFTTGESPGDTRGDTRGGDADRQAGQRRRGRDPLPSGGIAEPTDPRQPPWRRVGLDITA